MTRAALILAAGGSSRYCADVPGAAPGAKLLATLAGRPLVAWAVAPPRAADFDEVIVVEGAADLADALPADVTRIRNDDWSSGQASSLRAGLAWCARRGHQQCVVGLGDTPGLTEQAWRTVAEYREGPIVFATYEGRRGHPVRLDAEVWDLLDETGDEGARALARRRPDLVREVACVATVGDVNRLADLTHWRDQWN